MSTAALVPLAPVSSELAPVSPVRADEHPVAVYLARLASENSRAAMRNQLRNVCRILAGHDDVRAFPWHELRAQHTEAVRAELVARYAPATVNLALSALRGVLRAARRLGLIDAETFEAAVDLSPARGRRTPPGRELSAREQQRLVETCDDSPIGVRDAAIFAVLFGGGLRRSEVVALDAADYDPEHQELHVRRGKGDKDRLVPLASGAGAAVEAWLALRGADEPGPLFYPSQGVGRPFVARRMTTQAVYDLCRRRARAAGVDRFSPHDGRRSLISSLFDAGADVSAISSIAGHSSTDTTRRYDRRGHRATRQAAKLVHFPYRPGR